MTVWFTADTHFGHANILKYESRPFKDVSAMDAALIEAWNKVVEPGDIVYHLGDLAFLGSKEATAQLLKTLKGQIFLLRGNHDRDIEKHKARFVWIKDLAEIKIPDPDGKDGIQRIVLCHYAMRTWKGSHRNTWQLYGHSHGNLSDDPNALSMDIGYDTGVFPWSYEQVKERMKLKVWKPVDHHRSEHEQHPTCSSCGTKLLQLDLTHWVCPTDGNTTGCS